MINRNRKEGSKELVCECMARICIYLSFFLLSCYTSAYLIDFTGPSFPWSDSDYIIQVRVCMPSSMTKRYSVNFFENRKCWEAKQTT